MKMLRSTVLAPAVVLVGCAAASGPPPAESTGLVLFHDRSAEQACFGRAKIDEQICRADKRLMEARRVGDSFAAACYERRGREMRASWRIADQSRDRLRAGAGSSPTSTLDQERIASAEKSVDHVFAMLDDCEAQRQERTESNTSVVSDSHGPDVPDPIEPEKAPRL